MVIPANELKVKGVSIIETMLEKQICRVIKMALLNMDKQMQYLKDIYKK